jgi:hypothetical protein
MGHGVQSPVKVRAILVTPTKSSLPEPSTGMAETTSTFHMSGSSGQYALRMLKTNPLYKTPGIKKAPVGAF